MFSLFGRNLRKQTPGRYVSASLINEAVRAVERSRPTAAPGSGVALAQTPNGFAVRAVGEVAADFLTTSSVTKRSGATLGHGTARLQRIINGAYVDAGPEITVYSKWTDKAVNSGAYVTCLQIDGVWEVVDVDDCGNLT